MLWKYAAALMLATLTMQAPLIASPRVAISQDGHFLVIGDSGMPIRVFLPETSPKAELPASADSAVTLAYQQRGGVAYLLVLVNGMSLNGGNSMGPCGAGVEQRVWWLAIQNGSVRASKHQNVASCWRHLEEEPGVSQILWRNRVCTITWVANMRATDEVHHALRYDTRRPENGFDTVAKRTSPLKGTAAD